MSWPGGSARAVLTRSATATAFGRAGGGGLWRCRRGSGAGSASQHDAASGKLTPRRDFDQAKWTALIVSRSSASTHSASGEAGPPAVGGSDLESVENAVVTPQQTLNSGAPRP